MDAEVRAEQEAARAGAGGEGFRIRALSRDRVGMEVAMSIFCLTIRNIRRGHGRSVVGVAAYCARSRLHDERSGYTYDFSAAAESLVHSEVMLPDGVPSEWGDRAVMWNAIEVRDDGENALLASAIEGAIPGELPNEAGIGAAREFAAQELMKLGWVVDLSIHRALDAAGRFQMFAYLVVRKHLGSMAGWVWPDRLGTWRKHWAQFVNQRSILVTPRVLLDGGSNAVRGRNFELDVQVDGAAEIELRCWNGERLLAEPVLAVRQLMQGRNGFTREELVSLVRRLTAGETQFKEACHRVESLPGMVRLGRSESGEELFGFRDEASRVARQRPEEFARAEVQKRVASEAGLNGCDVLSRLREAVSEWEREGLCVRGIGLTFDDAKRFEKATGIKSSAVHGILGRWKKKKDLLKSGDVLVVNDVMKLSDRQKEWMLKAVRREKAKMAVVTAREFVLIDGHEVGLDERQSAALGWSVG